MVYDKDILRDLIIDGVETGITNWAVIENRTPEFVIGYQNGMSTSEIVADIVLNKGGSVIISDCEEDEDPLFELTHDRLIEAIEKNAEERPHDCDIENYDAETVDCIFQYAIYDDVIFG